MLCSGTCAELAGSVCCVVLDVFFPRGVGGVYGGQGSEKTTGDTSGVRQACNYAGK